MAIEIVGAAASNACETPTLSASNPVKCRRLRFSSAGCVYDLNDHGAACPGLGSLKKFNRRLVHRRNLRQPFISKSRRRTITSLSIAIAPLPIAILRWTPSARFPRPVGASSNHCCSMPYPTNSIAPRPLSLAQSRYPDGRALGPSDRPIVEPDYPSHTCKP
jgi:hypothetical protein